MAAEACHPLYLWVVGGESPGLGVGEAMIAGVYPGYVSLVFLDHVMVVVFHRATWIWWLSSTFSYCQGFRCGRPSMYSGVRSAGGPHKAF